MHDVFQRFVDRIIARPDIATLGDALAEVLLALDIPSYAYLLLPACSAKTQLTRELYSKKIWDCCAPRRKRPAPAALT